MRYHGKMENIFHLLPEAPKPRDWWKSKQNVARRVRTSMNIWKTEYVFEIEWRIRFFWDFYLSQSVGRGLARASFVIWYLNMEDIIISRNISMLTFTLVPTFLIKSPVIPIKFTSFKKSSVWGFWDKLENVEFNLKDFIIQCGLDRFPTKVEFEACGRQSLWGAMRKYALQHKKYSQSSDTDEKLLK